MGVLGVVGSWKLVMRVVGEILLLNNILKLFLLKFGEYILSIYIPNFKKSIFDWLQRYICVLQDFNCQAEEFKTN